MKKLPLFPSYFKWIAIAVFIINLVVLIAFKDSIYSLVGEDKRESIKEIGINILNISMYVMLFSKRKYDDEMLMQHRYILVAGALLSVIIYVFVVEICNLVNIEITMLTSSGVLFFFLFLVNFQFLLKSIKLERELYEE